MTAVASPPTFPQLSRPAWGTISGNTPMNPDEVRGMFAPRKQLSRSNSSSSISSTASNTTVATNGSQSNGTPLSATSDLSQWSGSAGPRKRPQPKSIWPLGKTEMQPDFSRSAAGRPNSLVGHQSPLQQGSTQGQMAQHAMRPLAADQFPPGQPVLYLLSLNGTFERKTIAVPFAPDSLRIGRQTNQKTVPTPTNGFFDSKVLSRQHAEIYAERNGKIYIRDVKSSNGTFVNGTRLSQENRESEPHELQTADHLELGIDIVSEDQKTVVHHKVAAKVEHAGFLSNTNNVLDMNFGDLDPANGTMMVPNGPVQMRGRAGSNSSIGTNAGRMMPNGMPVGGMANGMAQQRPFFLSPVATDQILKRLATEMRNARLQAQDLNRTHQFVNTLLSKDDIKDLDKSDASEPTKPQHIANGGSISFRSDAKTRFSDPPAPPPQQPLPEKPDVPSSKRGLSERPKSGPPMPGPMRQEHANQIIQLTEALNNAKRDIDSQSARMRELELMLQKEREARELAEELAKRLEESAGVQMDGSATKPVSEARGIASDSVDEETVIPHPSQNSKALEIVDHDSAASLQSRINGMDEQMRHMREQLELWKHRCEVAETERDEGRESLAEMVAKLRAEEAKRASSPARRRSRSRRSRSQPRDEDTGSNLESRPRNLGYAAEHTRADERSVRMEPEDEPALSRTNTITPATSQRVVLGPTPLQEGLPYASMLGVVLIGMGLMAYINGWQSSPRLES
ncbi:hypothetical protein HIM_05770 [Hirsutella minnesotensis 3608]|uniref:FHA domain-containing protein n=1 Tax=Hirsutella minnesotensis 3608 TaxID=1043627 RepID=A0A0F7ZK12_9HYPO|nr:hypothetical protein HIM_05770 [Hirsutella minnesotensis 3608]